jgi:circadian clock protein KaiC
MSAGTPQQVKAMLVRLFDWLKTQGITGLVTYLVNSLKGEETDVGISSLIDTWIEVRDLEVAGERNRTLYLLKSRGMAHSNQVRELLISEAGVSLADVYFNQGGVLLGSAKAAEDRKRARDERSIEDDIARTERMLELRRENLEAQIAALNAEYATEQEETRRLIDRARESSQLFRLDRETLSRVRTECGSKVTNGAEGR